MTKFDSTPILSCDNIAHVLIEALMATIFVNVNFYGHNHTEFSGLPDGDAPDWKGGQCQG